MLSLSTDSAAEALIRSPSRAAIDSPAPDEDMQMGDTETSLVGAAAEPEAHIVKCEDASRPETCTDADIFEHVQELSKQINL